MDALLGEKGCDKCGKLMNKDEQIVVISEGLVAESNELLDYKGDSVRFACHFSCWDGIVGDIE